MKLKTATSCFFASFLTMTFLGTVPAFALRTLQSVDSGLEEEIARSLGDPDSVLTAGLEEDAVFQEIQGALANPFPMKPFLVEVEGPAHRDSGVWVTYRGVGGFVPKRLLRDPSGRSLTDSERKNWLWVNRETKVAAYPVEISDQGYHKTERPLFFFFFSIIAFPEDFKLGPKAVRSPLTVETPRKLIGVPALFWILMERLKEKRWVGAFLNRLWKEGVDSRPWIVDQHARVEDWEGILQGVRMKIVTWVLHHHQPSRQTRELFEFFHSVASREPNTDWPDLPETRATAVLGMQWRAASPENSQRRQQMEVEAFV